MDFTLNTYLNLFRTLQQQGFSFLTFEDSLSGRQTKRIVLRHDVDRLPRNSLVFARIQADVGIRATFYFRIVPESFDEKIIQEIHSLGHEIGYHYEDIGAMALRHNGVKEEMELVDLAIESFKINLEKLRDLVPVRTICMHGGPMSKWDNRLLWKYYDYHDFGIVGEPYFDVNFNEVLYLTDTGRCWDGEAYNIRDKVTDNRKREKGREGDLETSHCSVPQSLSPSVTPVPSYHRTVIPFPKFHSTFDIIKAADEGRLPDKIMMTFHPQRWTDNPVPWVKELIWQNVKNVGKYFLVKLKAGS